MNDALKAEIMSVMDRFSTCVIATVDQNSQPEAATVGFSHNDELELIVGTSSQTRKFVNLKANPRVAIVVSDDAAQVQYEGTLAELDASVSDDWLQAHIQRVPAAKFFVNNPNQVWFRITPSWIRLTVHTDQNRVEEVSFV